MKTSTQQGKRLLSEWHMMKSVRNDGWRNDGDLAVVFGFVVETNETNRSI